MNIIYLIPKSSYISNYDSDFLFGYILTILNYFYGVDYTNDIIKKFENNEPPFLMSSTFYFTKIDNKKTLYFPKPQIHSEFRDINNIADYAELKSIKKQKYINYENLLELISSSNFNVEMLNNLSIQNINIKETSTPHSRINRITNSTAQESFYHIDEIFIKDGGLFFLYEGDLKIIEPALNFINHHGLGADASTGKGNFKIEISEISIPQVENPNYFINLSSYYPTMEEVEFFKNNPQNLFYEIVQKQGKIGVNSYATKLFKKKLVSYFSPGSVFPIIPNRNYYGTIKEVSSIYDTSIKFNGYSLNIKIRL